MEMASTTSSHHENPTFLTQLKATPSKLKQLVVDFAMRVKKTGEDDPRRVVHSLKVALAITLVSMIYYIRSLYISLGSAGMWAILTVVVVFEYTVGATLSKGLNRGFATLLASALGVGVESIASKFGQTIEPIILGCFVFLLVTAATFSRFMPNIKRRYDYGVLIFILTYALVCVSDYQSTDVIELANQRLWTIILGGATCIIISICIFPVWAGEDLHKLVVLNLEKLASFLEGFGEEYFKHSRGDKSFLTNYKSVFNTKTTEESLTSSMFEKIVQEPCTKMSSEAGKALKELGLSMKLMSHPSTSFIHIQNCRKAIDELNTTLQASDLGKWDIREVVPIIAMTSILVDTINCVETIYRAIVELSEQANFKRSNKTYEKSRCFRRCGTIKRGEDEEDKEFIAMNVPENVMEPKFKGLEARGDVLEEHK